MGNRKRKRISDAFIARLLTTIALSLIIGMIVFSHIRHENEKKEVPLRDSVMIENKESRQ